MIIAEASHIVAGGVANGGVFTIEALPFDACAIIGVEFVGDIPVVRQVSGEFVFRSLVIFRGILIEIVEIIVAFVGIVHPHRITAVSSDALVVHGGV